MRAGVHVSIGFRSKASPRHERGGFLPPYVTVCFENAVIRRSASATNRCAPSLEREMSSTRTCPAHFSLARRAVGAASSSR